MKHDPEELRRFADDIATAIGHHPDAMGANPELHTQARSLREAAYAQYRTLTEHGTRPKEEMP